MRNSGEELGIGAYIPAYIPGAVYGGFFRIPLSGPDALSSTFDYSGGDFLASIFPGHDIWNIPGFLFASLSRCEPDEDADTLA